MLTSIVLVVEHFQIYINVVVNIILTFLTSKMLYDVRYRWRIEHSSRPNVDYLTLCSSIVLLVRLFALNRLIFSPETDAICLQWQRSLLK